MIQLSIFTPAFKPKQPHCLYDTLFNGETVCAEVEAIYGHVVEYLVRNFGKYIPKRDITILNRLTRTGTPALKLLFVLFTLGHDAALRRQIEDSADQEPETQKKMEAYYYVLAEQLRSLFISPFTEHSAKRIALTLLGEYVFVWRSFNASNMIQYIDWHSARPRKELDHQVHPLFEEDLKMKKPCKKSKRK
jgi:hypothetical protein